MSLSLTGNFFLNARGVTFADGGGVSWSFNPNTNEISANASTGGASSGNPAASVGLSAVNGVAGTWMRSDAAPALSQAIAPTMTGAWVFTPAAGVAITVNAPSGQSPLTLNGTDIANAAINSSATANRAVWRFQQGGVNNGFIGVDGSQALLTGSSNGDLVIRSAGNTIRFTCTGGSTQVAVTSTAASFTVPIGWNGATPPAQVTGFGTPVGAAVVAGYNSGSSTSLQDKQTIAQILTIMKAHGMIGN